MVEGIPYLREWPFDVVAPVGKGLVWADREALRRSVESLLSRWGRHEASSLTVMWANFGAGKTHTLRFIAEHVPPDYLVCSSVLPQSVRTFVEVYRAILESVDLQLLATAGSQWLATRVQAGRMGLVDGEAALWALATGGESEQAILAERWLRGWKLTRADLNRVGARTNIIGNDEAVSALNAVVRCASESQFRRVVVLIDEFQRVGELNQKALNQVNQGIHTFFNANPKRLSLVLSMSFGRAENVKYHLTDEVRSRVDPEQVKLDYLTKEDVRRFTADLLRAYRLEGGPSDEFAPFSAGAVDAVADALQTVGITPRRLMQALGRVLEDALDSGPMDSRLVSENEARSSLERLEFSD